MLDVTTAILHDVGNSVNSVCVSADRVLERLGQSHIPAVGKLASLLDGHRDDLQAFLAHDAAGQQVPEFVQRLYQALEQEHDQLGREARFMRDCLDRIRAVLTAQQERARRAGIGESAAVDALVSVVLDVQAADLARAGAEVRCKVVGLPELNLERHKLVEILSDLVAGAVAAFRDADQPRPRVTIEACMVRGRLRITVSDNGVALGDGRAAPLGGRASLAARSMGGTVRARVGGSGRGALVEVDLPIGPEPHGVGLDFQRRQVSEHTWHFSTERT